MTKISAIGIYEYKCMYTLDLNSRQVHVFFKEKILTNCFSAKTSKIWALIKLGILQN